MSLFTLKSIYIITFIVLTNELNQCKILVSVEYCTLFVTTRQLVPDFARSVQW
jgi:hypothetical protein